MKDIKTKVNEQAIYRGAIAPGVVGVVGPQS